MILLVKSYHLEALADAFADRLSGLGIRDPLRPVPVLVPNKDTGRWLTLQLSEFLGVAMNLEMILPADWQWRQIRRFYPDLPKVTVSDRYPLYWSLMELFQDAEFVESIPSVAGYIYHDRGFEVDDFAGSGAEEMWVEGGGVTDLSGVGASAAIPGRRRPAKSQLERTSQIALQIASLFDKYLNNRPEMLLEWQRSKHRANGLAVSGTEGDLAAWQSRIWNRLCDHWQSLYEDERHANKAELWEEARDRLTKSADGEDLFLFNAGLFPAPIMELLQAYGKHQDVVMYQVYPPMQEQDDALNNLGKESPKLETLYSICDQLEWLDFRPTSNSLLGRVKRHWTDPKADKLVAGSIEKDSSVQIRSCHSPLREMEVLQTFLTKQFEEDPTLHPDDILVVTPDLRTYVPAIEAVFGSDEDGIPCMDHATGLGRSGSVQESYQCIEVFLSLLDSRFAFADVMDLFSMHPVMERLSITHSQLDQFQSWLEENTVYWGLDEHHRRMEGQPEERLHTWREALRRIWFGILVGGEQGDVIKDSLVYPRLSSTDDRETIGSFTNALCDLEVMLRQRREDRSVKDWCDWLGGWLDGWMDASSAAQIRSLLSRMETEADIAQVTQVIPYSIFKRHLMTRTKREAAGSAVFTKGILFSSMVPVRNIPYRMIAMVGLDEDSYPRKAKESEMDMMALIPHETDKDRRDEDRQMFLESILAAGDIHYVSFVGQDKRDNEQKAVSPIISEWVTYLAEATGIQEKEWMQREPLSAYSVDHFRNTDRTPVYSSVAATVADRLHRQKSSSHGFTVAAPFNAAETGERIQLQDLVSFYKNPYRAFVKKQLETTFISAKTRANEFGVDALETYLLFDTLLQSRLSGKDLDKVTNTLLLSGVLPAGYPGTLKTEQMNAYVHEAIRILNEVGSDRNDQVTVREIKISFPVDVDGRHLIMDGSVPFYLEQSPITVQQSEMSGTWAMHHWIQHLAVLCQTSSPQTYGILHNIKKEPKLATFTAPDHYRTLFQDLIAYYLRFLSTPEDAFVYSSYAYAKKLADTNDEQKALDEAQAAFEVDDSGMSYRKDLQDLYTNRMVGKNRSFDPSFVNNAFAEHVKTMVRYFDPKDSL